MKIKRETRSAKGIRFSVSRDGREIARAYLYLMTNDLHKAPFGLLEDVFVDEVQRGSGLGTSLVREAVVAAREAGCYKLIATSRTSRPKVHELYRRLGFEDHGIGFRMDLEGHTDPLLPLVTGRFLVARIVECKRLAPEVVESK